MTKDDPTVHKGARKAKVILLSIGNGKERRCEVALIEAPKGTVWTAASVETEKTIIVIRGSWRILVADTEIVLQPDHIVKVPASKKQCWEALDDTVTVWIEQRRANNAADGEKQSTIGGDPDQYLWGV